MTIIIVHYYHPFLSTSSITVSDDNSYFLTFILINLKFNTIFIRERRAVSDAVVEAASHKLTRSKNEITVGTNGNIFQ